jgi:hypothetical protein
LAFLSLFEDLLLQQVNELLIRDLQYFPTDELSVFTEAWGWETNFTWRFGEPKWRVAERDRTYFRVVQDLEVASGGQLRVLVKVFAVSYHACGDSG